MPCAGPWKRDRPKRESQRFGHQRPPSLHRMENGMDADDALNLLRALEPTHPQSSRNFSSSSIRRISFLTLHRWNVNVSTVFFTILRI